MTPEAKQFMIDRNMKPPQMARLFNVSTRTIWYWVKGDTPIPFAAIALMRAIQRGAVDIEWLAAEAEAARGGKSLSGK